MSGQVSSSCHLLVSLIKVVYMLWYTPPSCSGNLRFIGILYQKCTGILGVGWIQQCTWTFSRLKARVKCCFSLKPTWRNHVIKRKTKNNPHTFVEIKMKSTRPSLWSDIYIYITTQLPVSCGRLLLLLNFPHFFREKNPSHTLMTRHWQNHAPYQLRSSCRWA